VNGSSAECSTCSASASSESSAGSGPPVRRSGTGAGPAPRSPRRPLCVEVRTCPGRVLQTHGRLGGASGRRGAGAGGRHRRRVAARPRTGRRAAVRGCGAAAENGRRLPPSRRERRQRPPRPASARHSPRGRPAGCCAGVRSLGRAGPAALLIRGRLPFGLVRKPAEPVGRPPRGQGHERNPDVDGLGGEPRKSPHCFPSSLGDGERARLPRRLRLAQDRRSRPVPAGRSSGARQTGVRATRRANVARSPLKRAGSSQRGVCPTPW